MRRAKLVTIYWRDLPAQVMAQEGRTRAKAMLPQRFQTAIDRAAMISGLNDTDTYVAEWRRVSEPCGGDLQTAADTRAAQLVNDYPVPRVKNIVEAGGAEE